jgi:uncharacterized protein (DUF302 family)
MFTGFIGLSANLQAQSVKPVTVQSSKDFEGTESAIKKAVSGGGMQVLSEMDQGNILSMTGLSVKVHTFFIGNPNVGKEAFSADPSVGLVIPVRVNVYEENGKTYVSYFKPSELFASYNNQKVKMIGDKLDGKLQSMVNMISQ